MMMTDTTDDDLHQRIESLLTSCVTGNAVAHELAGRYAAWQTRAAIGALHTRRAQHHVDATAEALFPSQQASGPQH